MKHLLLSLALLCGPAQAQWNYNAPVTVVWQDSYSQVRTGRVGVVLWAYWFGFNGQTRYVQARVIDLDQTTKTMQSAALDWVQGKNPSLPSSLASRAIWDDPKTKPARDAATVAYLAEVAAGTLPIPPGGPKWGVPASGSSIYSAANGKLVSKIAGRTAPPNALCDATNPIAVGTSTYMPLVGGPASEVALCKKVSP
jgi:hypothetical protein